MTTYSNLYWYIYSADEIDKKMFPVLYFKIKGILKISENFIQFFYC